MRSLAASAYCLCLITSFEASTCIAGMGQGLGIMQVDILEGEVIRIKSDQI